jgi:hypothetical protein
VTVGQVPGDGLGAGVKTGGGQFHAQVHDPRHDLRRGAESRDVVCDDHRVNRGLLF